MSLKGLSQYYIVLNIWPNLNVEQHHAEPSWCLTQKTFLILQIVLWAMSAKMGCIRIKSEISLFLFLSNNDQWSVVILPWQGFALSTKNYHFPPSLIIIFCFMKIWFDTNSFKSPCKTCWEAYQCDNVYFEIQTMPFTWDR